jgi:hypothetical protein
METPRVRDIELRFCPGPHRPPASSNDVIYVHKEAAFVAAMDETLARVRPNFLVEIGIHDGGSTIYWSTNMRRPGSPPRPAAPLASTPLLL